MAVDFTNSPNEGSYDRFDFPTPYDGAALDPEYLVGSLEVVRAAPDARVAWDTVLPAPQRLFFTVLDFEYPAEAANIIGFNGATPVTPTVISRAESGQIGVQITPQPDGSVDVAGAFGTASDFTAGVTADVVFDQPVDRVHIEQFNPTTDGGVTFVEYTAMYGCQGLDVVTTSPGPTEVTATPGRRAFDVPFTITVGNTATTDDMTVYGPQLVDDLTPLIAASVDGPAGTLDGISALGSTGPTPACETNPSYDGQIVTDLLNGTGTLAPGEGCVVSFTARVSFPTFATTFTRTNSTTASSAGTATDTSSAAAALPPTIHADTAAPTAVTFAALTQQPPTTTSSTSTTSTPPVVTNTPATSSTSTTTTVAGGTTTTLRSSPRGQLPATGPTSRSVPITIAALLVALGGSLLALGHRRRPSD